MNDEQYKQISSILLELAKLLDVTKSEYDTITTSYQAVGKCLAEGNSPLQMYNPSIHPQGSFLLGTVVRPISEEDDLDIDLVCKLEDKPTNWTQKDLKNAVGDRLKNTKYASQLDDEGKRCWTILYGDNKYHLDVLPSFVCKNYREIITRYITESANRNPEDVAIHITDNTREDYAIEQDLNRWPISNPFGYAEWFLSTAKRAHVEEKMFVLEAVIDPVPNYINDKYVLQRVVQLLKRHRDVMFDGYDYKPISIIITTLAARSYNGERDIFLALKSIAANMTKFLLNRNGVWWVENPVNRTENFADRWSSEPQRQTFFFKWIDRLKNDINRIEVAMEIGLPEIQKVLIEIFGEKIAKATYENYGKMLLEQRKAGNLRVEAGTGILGLEGATKVMAHNFYGTDEETSK